MIKNIIFDLDGVLAKTDSYHYLSWKKVCDDYNLQFDKEMNEKLKGISRLECLDYILNTLNKELNEEQKNNILNEVNEVYNKFLDDLDIQVLFPECKEVLITLNKKGIKLGVASNSKNAIKVLKKTELYDLFDVIIDGNMVEKGKPDPECFIKCLDKLKGKIEETIIIEDAESGIIGALNAGFKVIAFRGAKNYNLTDKSIDNLIDILNYID